MNPQNQGNKSQLTLLFAAAKLLLEYMFPSLLLLKVHGIVSKASWSKDPWFRKQRTQCLKMALVLLIPSGLSLYLAKNVMDEMKITQKIEKTQTLLKNKQFKKGFAELKGVTPQIPFQNLGKSLGLIFAFPIILSLYIRTQNEVLVKTKRLERVLKENGFWREGKAGLAVYTPIGIVIDVTGRNPKDIVHDKALWDAINIQVEEKDWEIKPDQRSIVMFKNAFVLQNEYIYK